MNERNVISGTTATLLSPFVDGWQNLFVWVIVTFLFWATTKTNSLWIGCCIPVTYKGVYAGNISLINGDWYGLLVKNTNNPADNINIKLSADGTITEGNSAQ